MNRSSEVPSSTERGHSFHGSRLLAVAAATLLVGGALAAGSGLLLSPQRELSTTPTPSEQAPRSLAPSGPPPTQMTQGRPNGVAAAPLTRDVLDTASARLFPGGAGWAATTDAIYRTLDAGETWTNVKPAGWTASAGSALVDADTAYLASDSMPMVMAVTHSRGASWETATIDDRRARGAPTLSFVTPMRGHATFYDGDSWTRFRVYTTADGGRTWTGPSVGHIPSESMGKFEGPSGGVLYMVSGMYYRPFNNTFMFSADGGVTWKERTFPIGAASPKAAPKDITRFWFEPGGGIRLAIRAGHQDSIWSTRDEGKTWRLQTMLPRNTRVDENDFLSSSEWVVALDSGSGFRFTTDRGVHWHTRKTIDDTRIDPTTLSFASVDVGWALEQCYNWRMPWARGGTGYCESERPVLVSTKDGGRTWAPLGKPDAPRPPSSSIPGPGAWASAGTSVTDAIHARGPGVTATRLADGRVLVVGGGHGQGTASIYDPSDGRWTATSGMLYGRDGQVMSLLPDGRVIVIGGSYGNGDHATTEIYDATTGRWSRGPSMLHRKNGLQAVRLQDGRVLVVGTEPKGGVGTVRAEIYDPTPGRWKMTGTPKSPAYGSTPLVVLRDGRVLMAGGFTDTDRMLASAQLYDPKTGVWTATARMTAPRSGAMATLLPDGRVLVVGGARSFAGRSLPTTEVFDPTTGRWTATAPMAAVHNDASLTVLGDGRVLVAGGGEGSFEPIGTTEVYDPVTDAWSSTAPLLEPRFGQAAVALTDGSVLVVGGHSTGAFNYLGSAERYYPDGVPAG